MILLRQLLSASCIGLITIFSTNTWAFTYNAQLTGTSDFRWLNTVEISASGGGKIAVPSAWTPVSGLATTTAWWPGILGAPLTNTTFELNGPSGTTVSVPLALVEMQYNTGGNGYGTPEETSAPGNSCNSSSVGGNPVTVYSQNPVCFSSTKIIQNGNLQPFYFIRPGVLDLKNGIVNAFNAMTSTPPMGRYSATVPIIVRYAYISDGGVITYRNIPESLSLQVYYEPSYLTDVVLTGDGIILADYDRDSQFVSGNTDIEVLATGYFADGLRMTFLTREYKLNGPSTSIPYSITCGGCNHTDIVTNGTLINDTVVYPFRGTTLKFNLNFSYANISIDDVETATYTDTVTVLFEENF